MTRISPKYYLSSLRLAIQIDISPWLASGVRAIPRVVTLGPVVRERTDEPRSLWYLDFTRLSVYCDVSSDLYSRPTGTSSVKLELSNSRDKR